MENIQQVHERIYAHLIDKHKEDSNFRFTTRITNRYNRLEQGYWFHGNEHYLVVSFWTGTDWMNKTPNIMFVVTEEEISLEISVWDSTVKREFVDKYLVGRIDELMAGGKYYKYLDDYNWDTLTFVLDEFLENDKQTIDNAIQEAEELLSLDDNRIGFINEKTFNAWIGRIESYREWFFQQRDVVVEMPEDVFVKTDKIEQPYIISSVNIQSFGEAKECILNNIPENNRCIFLTGENGAGKSTILKAIGSALRNDHNKKRLTHFNDYHVELQLSNKINNQVIIFSHLAAENAPFATREGYAAYGPYRLMTDNKEDVRNQPSHEDPNQNLFELDAPLFDIENGLMTEVTIVDAAENELILDIIEEAISEIIPLFNGIVWREEDIPTMYRIGYADGGKVTDINDIPTYTFDQLATGARSVLTMIGDMMVRLFRQQPDVKDVGRLKGIVLIDEIDIHLHPKFQKLIVEQLAATFPKVQFIITTHSPIPMLGAPKDSVFFLVRKGYDHKITVEQITGFEIEELTPNTILTSPVFGMYDILYHDKSEEGFYKKVNIHDTYDEGLIADRQLQALLHKYKTRRGKDD
jgi:predicted ATPase